MCSLCWMRTCWHDYGGCFSSHFSRFRSHLALSGGMRCSPASICRTLVSLRYPTTPQAAGLSSPAVRGWRGGAEVGGVMRGPVFAELVGHQRAAVERGRQRAVGLDVGPLAIFKATVHVVEPVPHQDQPVGPFRAWLSAARPDRGAEQQVANVLAVGAHDLGAPFVNDHRLSRVVGWG